MNLGVMILLGWASFIALGVVLAINNQSFVRERSLRLRAPGTFLNVDGLPLHVINAGQPGAPGILFLNSSFGCTQEWAAIYNLLAETHHIAAIDRPGTGWSTRWPHTVYTMRKLADVAQEAANALGMDDYIVVGCGFGGTEALALSIYCSQHVRGAVLFSPSAYAENLEPAARFSQMMLKVASLPFIGELLGVTVLPLIQHTWFTRMLPALFAPEDVPAQAQRVMSTMIDLASQPKTMAAEAANLDVLMADSATMQKQYVSIHIPMLIVHGSADLKVPLEWSRLLHRAVRDSELEILEGKGHLLHMVLPPEEIAHLIQTFAARVNSSVLSLS